MRGGSARGSCGVGKTQLHLRLRWWEANAYTRKIKKWQQSHATQRYGTKCQRNQLEELKVAAFGDGECKGTCARTCSFS